MKRVMASIVVIALAGGCQSRPNRDQFGCLVHWKPRTSAAVKLCCSTATSNAFTQTALAQST